MIVTFLINDRNGKWTQFLTQSYAIIGIDKNLLALKVLLEDL